jgi:hypothetical protein
LYWILTGSSFAVQAVWHAFCRFRHCPYHGPYAIKPGKAPTFYIGTVSLNARKKMAQKTSMTKLSGRLVLKKSQNFNKTFQDVLYGCKLADATCSQLRDA